ncbi:hypothetical protein HPB51_016810 [Rhipicephalus microplus]|uniref:Transposable element n=1 Tax=Rhipicephalus microplus TaxID=6941 RepID=A0A9J6DI79_RHIMP|nr:hypothetical protein HPB51_016810 [Rhipicephalus microplus]
MTTSPELFIGSLKLPVQLLSNSLFVQLKPLTRHTHRYIALIQAVVFQEFANLGLPSACPVTHLKYAHTLRFNSDPIESLFATLRMSSGTNDMLDVRAALSGLEKILKTGIAAANVTSNVIHTESVTSAPLPGSTSSSQLVCTSSALVSSSANTDVQTPPSLKKAVVVLQRLTTSVLPQYLPSLQISATVYVGGYVARVVSEKMNCENCVSLCTKPVTNQPLLELTRNQDQGGLLYPSDQLLFILDTLGAFADSALRDNPTLQKPLSSLTKCTVPALCASRFLKCQSDGSCDHRARLMNLVSVHFLRPLL